MPDLADLAAQHQDLPEHDQVKAGQAIPGKMSDEHERFMLFLVKLVDEGAIDLYVTDTFLNPEVAETLSDEAREQVSLALLNIAAQARQIYDFYKSQKTPNESPHLQTMVEHIWQTKSKLEEEYGDVLKI